MKKFTLVQLFLLTLIFSACSSSDDPEVVNEEELITTLAVTLTPQGGGSDVTLRYRDLDGDGPSAPVITVSSALASGVIYNGNIEVLDETKSPAEDITEEIEEEDEEHQFFYTFTNGIATTAYTDADGNGNPVGLTFTLTAGAAGSGNFTVTLRHEPDKTAPGVSSGDITNAGGETDISATFPLVIN